MHEKILLRQERLQAQTQDTICTCWSVSHWHLWITVFVWAYALCGTKQKCSASVDCSGVIRKIHVRKIRLAHDFVTWWICKISAPETVRRGRMDPSQAKSLCWRTRLKVHTARRTRFKSNTLQLSEDITEAGKIAGPDPRKLYVRFGRFFVGISGFMYSFWLALCVELE